MGITLHGNRLPMFEDYIKRMNHRLIDDRLRGSLRPRPSPPPTR
jgi:hypothetical protein